MAKIAILFGTCFVFYLMGYMIGVHDAFKFFKEELEGYKDDSC